MNPEMIDVAVRSGKFSENTVRYWAEWINIRRVTPPDLEGFLSFIAVMENDVAWGLNEHIPEEWHRND